MILMILSVSMFFDEIALVSLEYFITGVWHPLNKNNCLQLINSFSPDDKGCSESNASGLITLLAAC